MTETITETPVPDTDHRCRVTGCSKPAATFVLLDLKDPDTGQNTGVLDRVRLCRTPGEAKSHDRIKLRELASRITGDVEPVEAEPVPPKGFGQSGEARGGITAHYRPDGTVEALDLHVEGVPKGSTFRAMSVPDDVWGPAKERAAREKRSLASAINDFLREYGAV